MFPNEIGTLCTQKCTGVNICKKNRPKSQGRRGDVAKKPRRGCERETKFVSEGNDIICISSFVPVRKLHCKTNYEKKFDSRISAYSNLKISTTKYLPYQILKSFCNSRSDP